MRSLRSFVFVLAAISAWAQVAPPVTCNISSTPNAARSNGESELTGDVIFQCTGGAAGLATAYNFTLFLNVNETSKITDTTSGLTEALLLIDDPLPGVANSSNGCAYFGQILGTPGVPACGAGSGNVYQGGVGTGNVIRWNGVPFVEPGPSATRLIRLTNVRGNAANIGVAGSNILGFVSMSGSQPIIVNQPSGGFVAATLFDAMLFSSAHGSGVTNLTFQELFAGAFKKRIENNLGGPLTAILQDQPGLAYCTESGFTPEFGSTTPGDIGSADTGTRLVIEFSSLNPHATSVSVPDQVVSSSGNLVAHRVVPPYDATFTGGTVSTVPGTSAIPVSGRAAEVLYEVTANAPYQGVNGCAAIESFTIPAALSGGGFISSHQVTGRIAPVEGSATASPTAPRPRFVP